MLNKIILRWFQKNGRDLPWRHTNDPYHILISEFMLQQTQVDRVLIKYEEFLHAFPTLVALARASLGDVLRAWSGLGYNRRAKNIQQCAQIVARTYGGEIPKDFNELQKLPGIGRSTAAALCSFAFGCDEPMIDTNIRRILARIFPRLSLRGAAATKQSHVSDEKMYHFAKKMIPKGKGKIWNWAMMDIGALYCKARHHDDAYCPFQTLHGKVKDFIYKKPQKKFQDSDRYYRGRILRILSENKQRIAIVELRATLNIAMDRCEKIIGTLAKERLIMRGRTYVALP